MTLTQRAKKSQLSKEGNKKKSTYSNLSVLLSSRVGFSNELSALVISVAALFAKKNRVIPMASTALLIVHDSHKPCAINIYIALVWNLFVIISDSEKSAASMICRRLSGKLATKPRAASITRTQIFRAVHRMFSNENGTARPSSHLILETSPETLRMLQQIDFLSFPASDDAEQRVVEVDSEDPFDSDDLEDLLMVISPPIVSPSKGISLPKSPRILIKTTNESSAALLPFPSLAQASQQAQKLPQKTKIKTEIQASRNRSQPIQILPLDAQKEPEPELSSPEYFSCKSESEGDLPGGKEPPILRKPAAEIAVKEEPARIKNNSQFSDGLRTSPFRPRSPTKICLAACTKPHSPEANYNAVTKRSRLSSPEKFQFYQSQEQYRLFSTYAAEPHPQDRLQNRHSNIQLVTQQSGLSLPNSDDALSDVHETHELEKVVKPFLLSLEQDHVLQLAKRGDSIFFTGSAGTGKSILLKSIIKALKQAKGPSAVTVTASTGLAACNIGGITLHSFAGIGLGKGDLYTLLNTVKKNQKALTRWRETEVLIIDEISMIDGRLFRNLDEIAREIRRNPNAPFGGIQLIVSGDFYQLPPVNKSEIQADGTQKKNDSIFAFESEAWEDALHHSIVLKEVFRQKGDQDFINMLNGLRHGIVSPMACVEFRRLSRPLECQEGIVPTELYATRYEVDRANNLKLNSMKGAIKQYVAKDGGSLPSTVRAQWLQNFLAPRELALKENAQVMCIKNIDDTLVNGSLGKIVRFVDRNSYMCERILREQPEYDLAEFEEVCKKEMKSSHQEPVSDNVFNFLAEKYLRDGSLNDDRIAEEREVKFEENTNAPDPFANGDLFVSLRSQSTDRKLNFVKALDETSTTEKYPLVRFLCPDGVTTRDHLMAPERWEILDDKTEEVLVSRVQFPLMLAWALSIHKSQGQTLQKVRVDLSRIFENGQAYVALSRAVSRQGLQVLNFREDRVRAHPVVEKFYDTLLSTEQISWEHRSKRE